MTLESFHDLDLEGSVELFASTAKDYEKSFLTLGVLHFRIKGKLSEGQTIYGVLKARGVTNSTISNASYASKVYAEVVAGKLTEDEYWEMTFQQCLSFSSPSSGSESSSKASNPSTRKIALPDLSSVPADQMELALSELDLCWKLFNSIGERIGGDAKAKMALAQEAMGEVRLWVISDLRARRNREE